MHVRLVSYSRPTEEFATHGIEDAQDLVAFCARVSNPANQFNTETSERLIRYLVQHQHWSPLEMVSACVEITLHAISRGKSSGTGVSHSKNSHSAMPILLEILRLISEKPDCRTLEIDKTVSRWITAIQTTENLLVYGKSGNRLLLEPVEKPTIGLSLTA